MANASAADVIERLKRTPYAEEFRQVFGAGIFDNADDAFDRVVFALQQYEKEGPDFHPFDSKYDQFQAKATVPPAIPAQRARTVRRRCLPTSASTI